MAFFKFCICLLIVLFAFSAPGQIYKYTDDEGHVRYTDDINRVPAKLRETVSSTPEYENDTEEDDAQAEEQAQAPGDGQDVVLQQEGDEVDASTAPQNAAAENILKLTREKLEKMKQEIDKQYRALVKEKEQLAQEKKMAKTQTEIETYNKKVGNLNQRAEAYAKKGEAYKAQVEAYNHQIAQKNAALNK